MTVDSDHIHDWRVDPSQVIVMLRDESRIRVVCADPQCRRTAIATSRPSPTPVAGEPRTWRRYRPKRDDRLSIEF